MCFPVRQGPRSVYNTHPRETPQFEQQIRNGGKRRICNVINIHYCKWPHVIGKVCKCLDIRLTIHSVFEQ